MTSLLRRVLDALEQAGCRPRRIKDEQYRAHCPGPCHARNDTHPSLGITQRGDRVLINCFVCERAGKQELLAALGLSMRDLFRTPAAPARQKRLDEIYPYEDIDGRLQAEKCRFVPKSFAWRIPDLTSASGYRWKKSSGVGLYRWPELIDVRLVLVVEGEKAVERLVSQGFDATCPPNGNDWRDAYAEALWRAGASVIVVIPDNDSAGRKLGKRVVESCHGYRPEFTSLQIQPNEPWTNWPFADAEDDDVQPLRVKLLTLDGLQPAAGVDDWLDAGHTADELRARIDTTPDVDALARQQAERKRRLARERQRKHRAKLRAASPLDRLTRDDHAELSRREGTKRSVRTDLSLRIDVRSSSTKAPASCNVGTFPSVTRDTAAVVSASDVALRRSPSSGVPS